MALFGIKKNKGGEKPAKVKKAKTAIVAKETGTVAPHSVDVSARAVLFGPRVTEKVSMLAEKLNIYTFHVADGATKKDIEKTINIFYKVKPLKVRIVKIPSKRTFVRGKRGVQIGGKKAYVYLKAGDKIEIA